LGDRQRSGRLPFIVPENDVENPFSFDLKINNKKVKFVRF
jgi:hypothetical protein